MKQRILVYEHLSAGGEGADPHLLAEGEAMRDAIVAGLAASPHWEVRWAGRAGTAQGGAGMVQPRPGESGCDFVAREAPGHERVWVVAPETGGLLAGFCARVEPARWVGCDLATVRLATGKHATLAHLARHGLCTPLDFERAEDVTRWVVKPDDGAGSMDTQLHGSFDAALAEAAQRRLAGRSVSLEPWVPGEALSLSLLCGTGEPELLSVNRQRIVLDAFGRVSFAGVDQDVLARDTTRWQALQDLARQVVRAMPGLRGFAGIDLVWHAQRGPVVIEVNPRVTTAFVGLSALLQRPLAVEILERCGGREDCDAAAA